MKLKTVVLGRPDEFARCFKQGAMFKNSLAVIHVLQRGDTGSARIGFSVSRRVGNAVERNRVKRWLREAVRPVVHFFPAGVDVVVSARARAKEAGYWPLRRALYALFMQANLVRKEDVPT